MYTGDTSSFPFCSRSGNQYIVIAYHYDSNDIVAAPFKLCTYKHRLIAYVSGMQRLKDLNMLVDLQILDNETSTEYKRIIKSEWGVRYQLVPPHIHFINSSWRAILTFKAHFISILSGMANTLPKNLWYLLIPQTKLTLNILIKSTLNPKISAWEYFQGHFDYKSTPLVLLVFPVIIHRKTSNRKSWYFRGKEGCSIGVDLYHYQCQRIIPHNTKSEQIFDTVEFRHQTIPNPVVTP